MEFHRISAHGFCVADNPTSFHYLILLDDRATEMQAIETQVTEESERKLLIFCTGSANRRYEMGQCF